MSDIEIIKTSDPDVVIERKTVDREVKISELLERKALLEEQIGSYKEIFVDDNYPSDVKNLLQEKNDHFNGVRNGLINDLLELEEELKKYGDNL